MKRLAGLTLGFSVAHISKSEGRSPACFICAAVLNMSTLLESHLSKQTLASEIVSQASGSLRVAPSPPVRRLDAEIAFVTPCHVLALYVCGLLLQWLQPILQAREPASAACR